MTRLSLIDSTILLAFAAWAIASGWRARHQASQSLEEYFLAGRSLSGWSAGSSMAATQFAADTPLLVTGLIATAGIFGLWRMWIYAVAFLLMGFVLAPCWRRARVVTDAELAELRFASRPAAVLRGVKAVYFGTVFNCTVLAMVLWAAKEIAEPFLTWHSWLPPGVFAPIESVVTSVGVPFARAVAAAADTGLAPLYTRSADNLISLALLVAVTLAYSTTGGLRGVVRTDIAQLGLMFVGTAAYSWVVVDAAGGMSALLETIRGTYADAGATGITASQMLAFTPSHARDATFAVLAVYGLQWLVQMNADGTGYLAQRSMACRSDADAKLAAVVFTGLQVVLRSLLWLPIGLGLIVLFPPDAGLDTAALQADREVTFVRGMAELLPSGVLGIMLTGMLAALASTIDTHLNWGASYWTNDLYARFYCRAWRGREASPRSLVWVARASNLIVLAIALAIMTQLSSIQAAWQASLLLGAGMGVLLVLRWFWWRINAWGELAAIGASMLLAPILLVSVPSDLEALRLLLMALGSTCAGVAASLLTAPEDDATLDAFYERAHPPGFWHPVARRCGRDPARDLKRLGGGLLATALASLSMFSLLTGLGSWLVESPAPVWWVASPGVWIAMLVGVGFGLIPVWWRLGFRSTGS
ncbi:MAG: Na+:solute symporter [Myxococcales bacterium]|nr:Na+:solute symporter [Myxococcales bacterium]